MAMPYLVEITGGQNFGEARGEFFTYNAVHVFSPRSLITIAK
jgi:hypothetical protein